MSYLLTRIRRVLATPPKEKYTHHVSNAIGAHWKTLFASPEFGCDKMGPELQNRLAEQQLAVAVAERDHQAYVTTTLTLWEVKRDLFQLDATLGGKPGQPGPLCSADYGTHWILFDWAPPETGGPVWGYHIERSADNENFYLADMGIEPEITLQHQPQNTKIYYRVAAFNGWGDGLPSPVFEITFDPELTDVAKRKKPRGKRTSKASGAKPKPRAKPKSKPEPEPPPVDAP